MHFTHLFTQHPNHPCKNLNAKEMIQFDSRNSCLFASSGHIMYKLISAMGYDASTIRFRNFAFISTFRNSLSPIERAFMLRSSSMKRMRFCYSVIMASREGINEHLFLHCLLVASSQFILYNWEIVYNLAFRIPCAIALLW